MKFPSLSFAGAPVYNAFILIGFSNVQVRAPPLILFLIQRIFSMNVCTNSKIGLKHKRSRILNGMHFLCFFKSQWFLFLRRFCRDSAQLVPLCFSKFVLVFVSAEVLRRFCGGSAGVSAVWLVSAVRFVSAVFLRCFCGCIFGTSIRSESVSANTFLRISCHSKSLVVNS